MRIVTWTDDEGRRWRRGLPDDAPDSAAQYGAPMGPPPLDRLNLPLALEVRLHNELHDRGVFYESHTRGGLPAIRAALDAALRLDVHEIAACYAPAAATLTAAGAGP